MITKFVKIKNCGIFQDHKWVNDLTPFNKYNLLYGWNGSGKTTLAKILRAIEIKNNTTTFQNAEFELEIADSSKIDHTSAENYPLLRVFNQEFVAANLDLFDATTKPIVFLSEEKVEEKKLLNSSKLELQKITVEITNKISEKRQIESAIEECFKESGKAIKDFLLGTNYANVNHNKSHASKIWATIKATGDDLNQYIKDDDYLIQQKEYTLTNSWKDKIDIAILHKPFNLDQLQVVSDDVRNLWNISLTSNFIERLKQNPDINSWVAKGLQLHKDHNSLKCEFCSQQLPESRIGELENHFSEEYNQLQSKIGKQISLLQAGIRNELSDLSQYLYEEVKERYISTLNQANELIRRSNAVVNHWIEILIDKKNDPFNSNTTFSSTLQPFTQFNGILEELNWIIQRHNQISLNHSKLAEDAKTQIENHYVAQKAKNISLQAKEIHLASVTKSISIAEEKHFKQGETIGALESALKNDTIAIDEINSNLHKFLGRKNIMLRPYEGGGYKLLRENKIAVNLSEGEKTAISLIYFMSKLKENDIKIEDSIVVFDDPISSFDSNHLFSAATFIINNCKSAKQVFVFTHNFWFFKQLRDWMKSKNKRNSEGVESIKSNFYSIQAGQILNAEKALVEPHSEYHFIFSTILRFRDSGNMSIEDSFSIANLIRRLLEAFSSFKTASNAGFNAVLQLAMEKGFDTQQKERIYYFLNKYSHLDRIESFDNTVEPLFEEGKNVVNDVMNLIEKLDTDHYKSMIKACV